MTENTPANEIQEYSKTEAALGQLRDQYKDVTFEVTTTAGMKSAKSVRTELRGYRTGLEKTREQIKKPVLDLGRRIDSEAKRITAEIVALEDPIAKQIKTEEDRKAEERQKLLREEEERVEKIEAAVEEIKTVAFNLGDKNVDWLKTTLEVFSIKTATEEEFSEYVPEAEAAILLTVMALKNKITEREQYEAEQEQIRKDREELELLRKKQEEARQKEQEKLDAELLEQRAEDDRRRKKQAEEDAAERKRLAEQKAKQDAMEKTLREEEERIEREKAAEQKAKDDAIAEQKRQQKEADEARERTKFPGEQAIITVLSDHFRVPENAVKNWLNWGIGNKS